MAQPPDVSGATGTFELVGFDAVAARSASICTLMFCAPAASVQHARALSGVTSIDLPSRVELREAGRAARAGAPALQRSGLRRAPALRRSGLRSGLRRSGAPALRRYRRASGCAADSFRFLSDAELDRSPEALRRAREVPSRPASITERLLRFRRGSRSFAREPSRRRSGVRNYRPTRRSGVPSAELQSGRLTVSSGDRLQRHSKPGSLMNYSAPDPSVLQRAC